MWKTLAWGEASRCAGFFDARAAVVVPSLLVVALAVGACSSPRYQRTPQGDGAPRDVPAVATDARIASDGDTATPVIPTGLPTGQACLAPGDCGSGFCFDGVCCATDCSNPCHSCASPGSVGTCLPAEVGTDPRDVCADEGSMACGNDGMCDGAGACRKYPAGAVCRAPDCSGATFTPAHRCNGIGACVATQGQSCDPFRCGTDGQCSAVCATAADCVAPASCTAGSCGKKPVGASCVASADCNSGFCSQGVCCQSACTDTCKSCAVPGSAGTCIAVPAGDDPLGQCADQGGARCATDGACDGTGKCRIYQSGSVCGAPACTGITATLASRCDGAGTCMAGMNQGCLPYACGTNGQCLTTCTAASDCAPGNLCNGGVCGKMPAGGVCATAADCASGVCAQGVCCQTSCSDVCMSCALPGKIGTCSPVPAAEDPLEQCPDQGAASCGSDGVCNGAGRCRLYAAGAPCGAQSCSVATETLASRCDGMGACAPGVTQSCAPFTCGTGTTCRSTCAATAECTAGNVCTAMSCGKKPPGSSCVAGADCASGFCSQGVCCQTECTGTCRSCALTGTAGTCSTVAAGQDPLDQCADAGAATCGLDGTCDGNAACRFHARTTVCAAATCTGATYSPARTCSGTGMCQAATTSSCGAYNCGPAGQCLTVCVSNADCASPNVCNGGVCSKKVLGTTCATPAECASGLCQQSVCCASACTGTCQSCALAGSAGTCTLVPASTDPLNQCTDAGPAGCGTDGSCNGAGGCRLYALDTTCLAGSCVGSTFSPARTCDGVGNCRTVTASTCSPFACDTTTNACRTTCATAAECAVPNSCINMSCGKLPNGATCAAGTACNSGFCAQGVCCNAACTGTCQACNMAGAMGTCTSVAAGSDPLNQCADQGGSSCGTDGACNGSGACRMYAGGTSCRPSTGVCDVTETCNGTTAACPADSGSSAPPVPASVVATPGNARVTLSWTASAGATGYVVRRSTTSGGPYTVVASPAASPFVDMPLANGSTYYYVVTATSVSGACQSGNSAQVSATPSPCAGGVYCEPFESTAPGAMPAAWTRVGGSMGDWAVVMSADAANSTRVLAQAVSVSATARFAFAAGGSPAAPWSGATSVSADVKVTAIGAGGSAVARVCLRYADTSNYYCLGLLPPDALGAGAVQIQSRVGGGASDGPSWPATVAVGTWYSVRLVVNAAGTMSAYLGATLLGSHTPATALPSGRVAVGTQAAQAAFDNIIVTQP